MTMRAPVRDAPTTSRLLLPIHLLGGLFGGALVGVALGLVGEALRLDHVPVWLLTGAGLLALTLAASRPRLKLGRRSLVPRRWARTLPGPLTAALWGFLLGTGVATVIPYTSFILLPVAQLSAGWLAAGLAGAAFGLARQAMILLPLGRRDNAQTMRRAGRMYARGRALNLALAATVLIAGVGLLAIPPLTG